MKVIKILPRENPIHTNLAAVSDKNARKKVVELFNSAENLLEKKLPASDIGRDPASIKDPDERDIEEKCFRKVSISQFIQILRDDHIWAIYAFNDESYYNKINKEKYQDQVCGFLQYYDTETRSGMMDHGIYFRWGKFRNYGNCVVIYLDPPPLRGRKHPPQYERVNYETNGYYKYREDVTLPGGQISDPPKPGGPPPPL